MPAIIKLTIVKIKGHKMKGTPPHAIPRDGCASALHVIFNAVTYTHMYTILFVKPSLQLDIILLYVQMECISTLYTFIS